MTKTSETIVFFGSGPVASSALALLLKDFSVEAVITKPIGHSDGSSSVLDLAKNNKIKYFLPTNRAELDQLFTYTVFSSRLAVLIDYGIIVSQKVIDYFPLGIVNSHFSLLPLWRGADPITFSILSGAKTTGVSLMLLTSGIDEGLLLCQGELNIDREADGPSLTNKLVSLSHKLITENLDKYIAGDIKPYPQSDKIQTTYSRKLTKEDGRIDWQKPAEQIEREIRAFIGWPRSYTKLSGVEVIVTKAHVIDETHQPGELVIADREIIVGSSNKSISIDRLKPAGKQEMSSEAFLAGYRSRL